MAGLELLTHCGLERYRELFRNKEDCQYEWDAALDDPGQYVTVLVGQCNNEEQQAASNEENLER